MINENKRLVMTIVTFAGIVAAIFFVNRWITQKAKDIMTDLPSEYSGPVPAQQAKETTDKPRRVIIDPANDPLAPVVPRVDARSPAPAAPARETNPRKVYEPMMNSVILVQ